MVQALLAKGADVNAKIQRRHDRADVCLRKGHVDVVQALLAKGADVNAKRSDGKTALILASNAGHVDVVQALLANGAEVNAKAASNGGTALMVASKLLESAGAENEDISKYASATGITIPEDSKDFPRGLVSYSNSAGNTMKYVLSGDADIAEFEFSGRICLGAGDGSSGKLGTGSNFQSQRIEFVGGQWLKITKFSFSKDGLLVINVESGKSYKIGFGFNMRGSIERVDKVPAGGVNPQPRR